MAYGGIMFYNLHMPFYILGTFTEYPFLMHQTEINLRYRFFCSFASS